LSETRDHVREEGGWFRGRPPARLRRAALVVWLGFIIAPIADALTNPGNGLGHWLAVTGAVAFALSYIWLVFSWVDAGHRRLATACRPCSWH